MKWHSIFHRLGWTCWGFAGLLLLPLMYALWEEPAEIVGYLIPMGILIVTGGLLKRRWPDGENLQLREGIVLLILIYSVAIVAAAVPFWWVGDLALASAIYEATSGLTTTGGTVYPDIESVAAHLQFWRSFLQAIGGITIILLFLLIPSVIGVAGLQLNRTDSFKTHAHGLRTSLWIPGIPEIVVKLVLVYGALHLPSTLWLMAGGLDLHDALCHSFGLWATGGFSNYNDGWAAFESPFLEWGAILFMTIAGLNLIFLVRLQQQHWQNIQEDSEFLWYLSTIFSLSFLSAFFLRFTGTFPGLEESLRHGLFQTVSVLTNTGIQLQSYLAQPIQVQSILFLALFVGACTGSSSSGMRMQQLVVMWKYLYSLNRRMLQPLAIVPIRINGQRVGDEVFHAVLGIFALHLVVNLFGGMVLTLITDLDIFSAWQLSLISLWNIGSGFGQAHNQALPATLSEGAQLYLALNMLTGRLELVTFLLFITPGFWRR